MAIPRGLFNPKNAVESAGGFKEGIVQIDTSVYKVHRGKSGEGEPERAPILALAWGVTRLDEDQEVMRNDEGEALTEELIFSAGGKSLAQVHPGRADSADDEEIEDAGTEVNAEGSTVFLVNQEWHPHKKSAMTQLTESLKEKGMKEDYLERVWAPDYVGCVFMMKNKVSDEKMQRPDRNGKLQDYPINYKVVDRIIRGPGSSKATKKGKAAGGESVSTASGSSAGAKLNGKADSDDKVEASRIELGAILNAISVERDGTQMSWKALNAAVSRVLMESPHIPTGLHRHIMDVLKDHKWLASNGPKYDVAFNPELNQFAFGQQKAG